MIGPYGMADHFKGKGFKVWVGKFLNKESNKDNID